MPNLEVEVMVDDNHLFIVDVESILEVQELQGSIITCKVCGKKRKVTQVGTPSRKQRIPRSPSEGQKSLLED